MAPVKNSRVLFVQPPTGYPQPGVNTTFDDSQMIDPDTVSLNGGFLLKTLVLSIEPYNRGLMMFGYQKGLPITSFGFGRVIRTENPDVKAGDHIYGMIPVQEYSVVADKSEISWFMFLENKEKIPWSLYVGVAGVPGQTAYCGWKEFASPKKGDVVFVTTGSGPVGATVIQLAKQDGCKVIASAGSDEKVAHCIKFGADVAFNYKTTSLSEVLAKEGPVDIYWDNVGGETLDNTLLHAGKGARFIECGMISVYNNAPPVMKNMLQLVTCHIKMYGVNVSVLLPKYEQQFYEDVPKWLAEGKLKYLEDTRSGIEHVEQAILDVQLGKNIGKAVISVADDS